MPTEPSGSRGHGACAMTRTLSPPAPVSLAEFDKIFRETRDNDKDRATYAALVAQLRQLLAQAGGGRHRQAAAGVGGHGAHWAKHRHPPTRLGNSPVVGHLLE